MIVEASDLFVPGLPHRKIHEAVCPECGWVGGQIGGLAQTRHDPGRYDSGTLMRLAGLANIGELVHEDRHELSLLISYERIWSKVKGVPDGKVNWPAVRPVGNSR